MLILGFRGTPRRQRPPAAPWPKQHRPPQPRPPAARPAAPPSFAPPALTQDSKSAHQLIQNTRAGMLIPHTHTRTHTHAHAHTHTPASTGTGAPPPATAQLPGRRPRRRTRQAAHQRPHRSASRAGCLRNPHDFPIPEGISPRGPYRIYSAGSGQSAKKSQEICVWRRVYVCAGGEGGPLPTVTGGLIEDPAGLRLSQ